MGNPMLWINFVICLVEMVYIACIQWLFLRHAIYGPSGPFTRFMKPKIEGIMMFGALDLDPDPDPDYPPTPAQIIRWRAIRLYTIEKNFVSLVLTTTTVGLAPLPFLMVTTNLIIWGYWTARSILWPVFKSKIHNVFNV